jgi:hypothetical protein
MYAPTDKVDLRMDPLCVPFFQYLDFLDVGYAYQWVFMKQRLKP